MFLYGLTLQRATGAQVRGQCPTPHASRLAPPGCPTSSEETLCPPRPPSLAPPRPSPRPPASRVRADARPLPGPPSCGPPAPLRPPFAPQGALYGSFSAPKAHEVVVNRGKALELLRPDELGRCQSVAYTEVFGTVRAMAPLRLPGAAQDYVVVGSDSGRVVVLQFRGGRFEKVHQETFGKSGCRRIVPGQFVAADPKGRAVMVGAVEKQKFVYVMNRDSDANLTISSPLEAHKSHTLTFHIAGLDCGFDNPVFAAIELDYGEADQDHTGEAAAEAQKHLTYYELDLGLNHVVRKWTEPIDNGANRLIAVPGGADGPGGVLICCENFLVYKHEDHRDVRAVIPRRHDLPHDRGVLVVAAATHKQKAMFFFLVQTEYGDIFKVTLDHAEDRVTDVAVKYFDTIPVCSSISVLKSGFLYASSDFGSHGLYQFEGLGDEEGEVEARASDLKDTGEGFTPVFFEPRGLKNLSLVDEIDSLSPITKMRVGNLTNEDTPQIYSLCGTGPRSTLKVMRPGLGVTEMAATKLQGTPNSVWTIKSTNADKYHAYIVMSFVNATMVLAIGDTVEEVNDSGFLDKVPTLQVQLLADDSVLQVHAEGLRHIKPDGRVNEWRCPGRKKVAKAASNARQAVVALTGGEVVYFQLNSSGQMVETDQKDLAADVACLNIAPIPEGRLHSRFLAVGGFDATIRLLSLDAEDCLTPLAVQAVSDAPSSLLFLEGSLSASEEAVLGLFLQAGLANGTLLRTEVDKVSGQLSDTRTRFVGTKAPKLRPTVVRGKQAMLCMSTRPWIGFDDGGRFVVTPLAYEQLEDATGFNSEQCVEGFVAVTKDELRVVMVDKLSEAFHAGVVDLSYTPRGFVIHEAAKMLAVIEGDRGVKPVDHAAKAPNGSNGDAMDVDGGSAPALKQLGAPRAAGNAWASCVRLVDPLTLSTAQVVGFEPNEVATSICLVDFEGLEGTFLAVGGAVNMTLVPRAADEGFVALYRFSEDGKALALHHRTPLDGIPSALAGFQGKLLAGVGKGLRLYMCGKKKLLKKCENKRIPNFVVTIETLGDRIYVGDVAESFHFLKYKKAENQIVTYADDIVPRYVSASQLLDFDTLVGADKFGNVFIARLPGNVSQEIEDDPTGGKMESRLQGAPYKLEDVVNFNVGDTVTALQRASLQPGAKEVIIYGTVMGQIGCLFPFTSREDVDFFTHLEMHMRQENPPLCGRDHMAFRSAYFPVKNVVDGDLCEQYPQITMDKQQGIAEELDRTPGEVLKKLEEVRNRVI